MPQLTPPELTPRDTPTPAITLPVTPAEEICTPEHALFAFDVLAAHFEHRDPVSPPFPNAKDK